jgi:hypothetical protein
MDVTSKIVAMTMLDAYSKILELSSVNNLVSDSKIDSNMYKFDVKNYVSEFETNGTQPLIDNYVVPSKVMSTEEIIFQGHEAKANYEKVVELYSRYGELNKIALGVK